MTEGTDMQPLFTSSDGKSIYAGNIYFSVHIERGSLWLVNPCKAYASTTDYRSDKDKYRLFSTKDAADEYVLKNKPAPEQCGDGQSLYQRPERNH